MVRLSRNFLPRGLFARTLLIIVLPTLITLSLATYIFFKRHWSTVTNRMTYAVAGEIAMAVSMFEAGHQDVLLPVLAQKTDIVAIYAEGDTLPARSPLGFDPLLGIFRQALRERLDHPYVIRKVREREVVSVAVQVASGVYYFDVPERRIYTPTTEVFIAWMMGSSVFLSAIALLFMRNQVRPIRRLADAAEAIGKGQDVPWFKLEGASEVRQAAAAVMVMRDRLKRQIAQRTAMLAGVSHDLRTPLTRMKLQIEMMKDGDDKAELSSDIDDMHAMLEAYLAFARGEESEVAVTIDMDGLVQEVVGAANRLKSVVYYEGAPSLFVTVRKNAMKRCLSNLISNALRYGKHVWVTVDVKDHLVTLCVDDDGPGIPEERREDMFRPFTRMDESRNAQTGGVGLGLTIARDVVRSHGGDIVLETSPHGGLRARIWIPI